MSDSIGGRIRKLRLDRDLSQSQLAADVHLSGSYLSLIEAGRRPATQLVLEILAERLACSVEYLETGRGGPDDEALELELRFAEMALRVGDVATAEEGFSTLLEKAGHANLHELRLDAIWGRARAREARGQLEEAIADYEALVAESHLPPSLNKLTILTALCRAYRECGDLSHAIEIGESALEQMNSASETDLPIEGSVELTSTLVGCYYERGDLTKAHTLARDALSQADTQDSPRARAAALWNAGLVAEARGDLRTARTYVDRALALYSEGDNARAIALLKIASAWLLLREPEPPLREAERLLAEALAELPSVGTAVDIAYGETELARAHLLDGKWQEAIQLAESSLNRLGESARIESARARLILGHAKLESGDIEGAVESYTAAAGQLRSAGAQRQAASAWRELAEAMARLGRADEALDAYRQAADAVGVSRSPEVARSNAAARRA